MYEERIARATNRNCSNLGSSLLCCFVESVPCTTLDLKSYRSESKSPHLE